MSVNNEMLNARIMLLHAKAKIPTRQTVGSAGFDLSSVEDCQIPANGKAIVKTGISIQIPQGHYGRVAPRSGLAWKNHIDVGAGVIDSDYRGEIGVVLFNHSNDDFKILSGDRVAQLIFERISIPEITVVDSLDVSFRGIQGYGSTGI